MDGKVTEMSTVLKVWLWISVAAAIVGAFLLFPIGAIALNVVWIVAKVGMIVGLILLLFPKKKVGFNIWVVFCAVAITLAIVNWSAAGFSALIIISIVLDVLMPVIAYVMMRKKPEISK